MCLSAPANQGPVPEAPSVTDPSVQAAGVGAVRGARSQQTTFTSPTGIDAATNIAGSLFAPILGGTGQTGTTAQRPVVDTTNVTGGRPTPIRRNQNNFLLNLPNNNLSGVPRNV